MAVTTMKSSVIEFQMAPLIKSLAKKYLFQREKQREREIIRGRKTGKREQKRRAEQRKANVEERGWIKRLFCVESETHFLVRG